MSWRRRVSLMYAGKVGSDSSYRYPISTEAKGLEAIHYEWDFPFRALRLARTTLLSCPAKSCRALSCTPCVAWPAIALHMSAIWAILLEFQPGQALRRD